MFRTVVRIKEKAHARPALVPCPLRRLARYPRPAGPAAPPAAQQRRHGLLLKEAPMDNRSAVQVTAGYYQASVGLRLFRFTLGSFQRFWPALAVRAAVRLFCTPLPPKWLQRRVQWGADW